MAYGTSASDRLAAVRAAIEKVLHSQEYYVGSRRNRYAELRDLQKLEERLMDEVAAESGTSPYMSVIQTDRAS